MTDTDQAMNVETASSLIWHATSELPQAGSRIIALFDDGSGAQLFWVVDDGVLMDNDGHESSALGKDYHLWAYLPSGFRLWIEDNLDD